MSVFLGCCTSWEFATVAETFPQPGKTSRPCRAMTHLVHVSLESDIQRAAKHCDSRHGGTPNAVESAGPRCVGELIDGLGVISRHGFEQCQARVRVAQPGPERSWLPWHGSGQDCQWQLFHERAEEIFKSQSIELYVCASLELYDTAALSAILRACGRVSASV